jgi:signal transduction histidine kinase
VKVVFAALALGGVTLGVVAYEVQIDDLENNTQARAIASVLAALSFLAAGLFAWSKRRTNPLGRLMVATSFALLARQLRYSHDDVAFTAFTIVGELGYALIAHVALAYPFGRVTDRLERAFISATYLVAVAFPLAILLVYDSAQKLRYFDPYPRESVISVAKSADVTRVLEDTFGVLVYGVLSVLFLLLVVRKLVRATPRARRILLPLLVGSVAAALWALLNGILTLVDLPTLTHDLFWWQIFGIAALPLALLAGLLRARLARAQVGDLVVQLEQASPDELQHELALALGDPSLEVAYWLPERGEFVDPEGRRYVVPDDDSTRAVTKLDQEGQPLGVLVHDPTLREEPKLVEGVAAAARLALQNARLVAEVNAQLEKVKESRSRLVVAADDERRRIERDIHDGAQQRLVALALELRSAQKKLGQAADPELERLLSSTADELQIAVEELRELARGIHPAVLTESGLTAALESLATRLPLPVLVEADVARLPADVEATAYFVASEALQNVVKHAEATKAAVNASHAEGLLVIQVVDNGVGGATANGGFGLRGLADRVEAHGGRLRIESIPGSGTRVVGEIPCAS